MLYEKEGNCFIRCQKGLLYGSIKIRNRGTKSLSSKVNRNWPKYIVNCRYLKQNVFLCIIVQNRDVISGTENEDLLPKMLGLGWGESAKLSALSPTHTIQVV